MSSSEDPWRNNLLNHQNHWFYSLKVYPTKYIFKLSLCSCLATDSRLVGHEFLIMLITLIYSQNASESNFYSFLVTENENDAGNCCLVPVFMMCY